MRPAGPGASREEREAERQADRRYPVGRSEDRKGCLKENKQETEEQSASAVLGADGIVLCMGVLKGSSRKR